MKHAVILASNDRQRLVPWMLVVFGAFSIGILRRQFVSRGCSDVQATGVAALIVFPVTTAIGAIWIIFTGHS